MSNYTVKQGESINDVVLNATGAIANLDAVLTANGFAEWTPVLTVGQVITIPVTVSVDANIQRQLAIYPAVNNVVDDVINKVEAVFQILDDNWILTTGFWNDTALWKDNKTWVD